MYGVEKERLKEILSEVEGLIKVVGDGEVDLKKVKEVDKRLKGCTNPEKVPGTALYVPSSSTSSFLALSSIFAQG